MSLDSERKRRAALFPQGAYCEDCLTPDPLVLVADARRILCAVCYANRRGLSPFESHHLAGRRYGIWVVRVSANVHRRLTARQRWWLSRMRNVNPSVRPRIGLLRGFGDLCYEAADALEARNLI